MKTIDHKAGIEEYIRRLPRVEQPNLWNVPVGSKQIPDDVLSLEEFKEAIACT